jgi:hypothetical protein
MTTTTETRANLVLKQPTTRTPGLTYLPATGAIVPLQSEDGIKPQTEITTAVLALTPRICEAPIANLELLERCGRVVLVAVEPQRAGDPIIPIPLARLPERFWALYAKYFNGLRRFLVLGNWDYGRGNPVADQWRIIEQLVGIASDELRGPELVYLNTQLRAALAGESVERWN